MTTEQNAPRGPESFLRAWPGRFRHAKLVRRLHGDEVDDDLAQCLLDGISVDRTVDDVLEEFADKGEFNLAELLLAESEAVSERVRARFADLEPLRAERSAELAIRLRALTDEASAAGVPFEVHAIDLEAQTRVSWPAVETILAGHRERISRDIARFRDDLTARNRSDGADPRLRAAVDSLIAAGRLALARRLLEEGTSDLMVPEAQPALPPWRWSEPVEDVLGWHVDPRRPRPPEFSAWRAVGDAQDLIEAAEALGSGSSEAAREFALTLERFLDPDAPEPAVHEFSGGWLSTVTLFRHPPLASFHATAGVDLLVLPPGVQSAPSLRGVDQYLAVGPDLQAGGGFRTRAAALTMVDILRLATLESGRAIGLARIAGSTWPLSALGVDTPAGLARLLADNDPWHLLAWLCDLAGIGGSATAEDLQFQTGDDAQVLYTLLMNLVDAVPATANRTTGRPAGSSPFRDRGLVGVESAVLRDCRGPSDRAAFWAALLAEPPGTPLALDALVIAAVFSAAGDDADWESVLPVGFDWLREQWFVEEGAEDDVSLRPLGVLTSLRGLAERRLAECALELTASAVNRPSDTSEPPRAWSMHRYALNENWVSSELRTEMDSSAGTDLTTEPDALIEAASRMSGSCDVAEVAGSLVALADASFPAAEFVSDIPERTIVAVPERVLLTVLYELLENALEATERAGRIYLSARADDTDVLIDLYDDGPGLDPTITRTAQVFRPRFSTRGSNRGTGLHLARRITEAAQGELEVAERSEGHPVFKGAHFTLILPGSS
ncbi:ATP-binding protein [Jiangella sp. DSM 45060]|uniref:ATP-binding protein n=1 Tax=Jiangella sp. DSM 45060 TaxID=1798224 RepID=UPI00087B385A|nr:ATP-binding protein [Jiangella sp. DSM 45060]SDT20705.1 Histidine kinase-, DNA gyrase B-, and HSP90-like ATPase [Jiangella sp. DSM 45060]